jgi:hypothetical protein
LQEATDIRFNPLVDKSRTDRTGMYRFTSVARPIDPAYLTNRALLIVLPVAGLLSAGLATFQDMGSGPLSAAISGVLVAFAAWALTRELAPDYQGAAFVALALAWLAHVAFGTNRVLLLFVALVLVRAVNRSTGLPWRPLDTLGVIGFCAWAAINTQQPLILLIASLAFALDAILEDPLRLHLLAAAACLAGFAWILMGGTDLFAGDLALRDWSLAGAFALGIAAVVKASTDPISYCDVSPDRLNRVRVNAGLVVGSLMAVQALLTDGRAAWLETPIWICIIAVLLSSLARRTS